MKNILLKDVKEVYEQYKEIILVLIPKKTGVPWNVKTIKFKMWDKDYWSYKGNIIFMGDYYKPKSKILASIIHEAIHMNTINKRTISQLTGSKEKALAREITTCILANQIITIINNKFGKNFDMNNFDEPYAKYKKQYKKWEKLGKNKNYYEFFKVVKKEIIKNG